jgi:elongation factor Ts
MAQITAAMVKQLREMTDSPMMECKKALVEADGDIDKAVDVLRTMGIAKAVKKAGRDTNEGTVGTFVSEDGRIGAMVEVSCETDFVGTNPKFTGFASEVAQAVANNDPADIDALKASSFAGDETVDAALTEMIHVMGENMKIARFTRIQVENGAVASYVHGGKIGVLVEFGFEKPETASNETFKNFAHDVPSRSPLRPPSPPVARTCRPRPSSTRWPSTRSRPPIPASPSTSSRRWPRVVSRSS